MKETNDSYICSICKTEYSYKDKRIEVGEQYWLENCCSKKCYCSRIMALPQKVLKRYFNPETKETIEALVYESI